jgi:mycothiol synthase
MNARLPEGYTSRPVLKDDSHQIAQLSIAQSRWVNGANETIDESIHEREEELKSDWEWDPFDLKTDTLAVFSADHQAVGFAEIFDLHAPHVNPWGSILVDPEHLKRGIGSFLADWLEDHARGNLSKAPPGARVVLRQDVEGNNPAAIDLLTQRGYSHVNDSYRMRIDLTQPPSAAAIPQGIVIRQINGEEEERLALFIRYESFLDHRGAIDEPFEAYYKRWKSFLDRDKNYDPSLWFLALDGEQPAGVAISYNSTADDPEMAWVQSLGVCRPWRKRGLGLALLQVSFAALYARGKPRVGLGVDASSLTGATRLYERAGMHIERVYHGFELELRDGIDLTRQSID